MKTVLKWTLFILVASAAMAAGMFCLAQYFDSKETDCNNSKPNSGKTITKTFHRHYTKLF